MATGLTSTSPAQVNTAGHQSWTELSLWDWWKDTIQRWFTAAMIRTMTSGTRRHGRRGTGETSERVGHQQRVEPEYFHMLLCELWIYLDRTRHDCEDKLTLFWSLWFSLYSVWMKCVLWWINKAIKLVLSLSVKERNLNSDGVRFFLSLHFVSLCCWLIRLKLWTGCFYVSQLKVRGY